jgi:hypothetical protein
MVTLDRYSYSHKSKEDFSSHMFMVKQQVSYVHGQATSNPPGYGSSAAIGVCQSEAKEEANITDGGQMKGGASVSLLVTRFPLFEQTIGRRRWNFVALRR